MDNNNQIDLYMYHGIKIEAPFEHEIRQRAVDRESRIKDQEDRINLDANLLKLKYSEQQNKP